MHREDINIFQGIQLNKIYLQKYYYKQISVCYFVEGFVRNLLFHITANSGINF